MIPFFFYIWQAHTTQHSITNKNIWGFLKWGTPNKTIGVNTKMIKNCRKWSNLDDLGARFTNVIKIVM